MNTIVILAGGKSKRMGTDKLCLPINGESMLASAVRRFSADFDEIFVSVAQKKDSGAQHTDTRIRALYSFPQVKYLRDEFPNCGPMAGLHAALKKTADGGVFLVAADMPFANAAAAQRIISLGADYDAALIRHANGYLEPLFAYYSKSMLSVCERCLTENRYQMLELLKDVNIKYVTVNELGECWSDDLLFNINYPADYSGLPRRKTGTENESGHAL